MHWNWLRRSLAVGALALAALVPALPQAPVAHADFLEGSPLQAEFLPAACGGEMIVSIRYTVMNSLDYGGATGDVWAVTSLVNTDLQVFRTGPNTFCAIDRASGLFGTVEGRSPAATGYVSEGIEGLFEQNYRYVPFTATLRTRPLAPVTGFVGIVDRDCYPDGSCGDEGAADWWTWYFQPIERPDFAMYANLYHSLGYGDYRETWRAGDAAATLEGDIVDEEYVPPSRPI